MGSRVDRHTYQSELLAHPKLAKHSVHTVRLDKNIENQTLLREPRTGHSSKAATDLVEHMLPSVLAHTGSTEPYLVSAGQTRRQRQDTSNFRCRSPT